MIGLNDLSKLLGGFMDDEGADNFPHGIRDVMQAEALKEELFGKNALREAVNQTVEIGESGLTKGAEFTLECLKESTAGWAQHLASTCGHEVDVLDLNKIAGRHDGLQAAVEHLDGKGVNTEWFASEVEGLNLRLKLNHGTRADMEIVEKILMEIAKGTVASPLVQAMQMPIKRETLHAMASLYAIGRYLAFPYDCGGAKSGNVRYYLDRLTGDQLTRVWAVEQNAYEHVLSYLRHDDLVAHTLAATKKLSDPELVVRYREEASEQIRLQHEARREQQRQARETAAQEEREPVGV